MEKQLHLVQGDMGEHNPKAQSFSSIIQANIRSPPPEPQKDPESRWLIEIDLTNFILSKG